MSKNANGAAKSGASSLDSILETEEAPAETATTTEEVRDRAEVDIPEDLIEDDEADEGDAQGGPGAEAQGQGGDERAAGEQAPRDDDKAPGWYRKTLHGYQKQIDDLKKQVEAQQAPPQQRQEEAPAEAPDPFDDPEGFRQHVLGEAKMVAYRTRMETLADIYIGKHGEGSWDELTAWVSTRPDIVQQSHQHPNPYEWALGQLNREKVASEVGEDPKAWRDAEREKIREEVLAELSGGGAETATTTTRRPLIPGPASQQRSARSAAWGGPAPLSAILDEKR